MANLLGQNIGTNYKGILSLDSTINTPLDATLRAVTDGDGNASPLQLSTDAVSLGGATGARLGIKGSGSTFSTTALLVQNSAGTNLFRITDDGAAYFGNSQQGLSGNNITLTQYFISAGSSGNCFGTFSGFAASAIVQCESTTRGFLPPRMTTTQKNAIAAPASGLVVYDTTLNKLCVRTASAWETITSV